MPNSMVVGSEPLPSEVPTTFVKPPGILTHSLVIFSQCHRVAISISNASDDLQLFMKGSERFS